MSGTEILLLLEEVTTGKINNYSAFQKKINTLCSLLSSANSSSLKATQIVLKRLNYQKKVSDENFKILDGFMKEVLEGKKPKSMKLNYNAYSSDANASSKKIFNVLQIVMKHVQSRLSMTLRELKTNVCRRIMEKERKMYRRLFFTGKIKEILRKKYNKILSDILRNESKGLIVKPIIINSVISSAVKKWILFAVVKHKDLAFFKWKIFCRIKKLKKVDLRKKGRLFIKIKRRNLKKIYFLHWTRKTNKKLVSILNKINDIYKNSAFYKQSLKLGLMMWKSTTNQGQKTPLLKKSSYSDLGLLEPEDQKKVKRRKDFLNKTSKKLLRSRCHRNTSNSEMKLIILKKILFSRISNYFSHITKLKKIPYRDSRVIMICFLFKKQLEFAEYLTKKIFENWKLYIFHFKKENNNLSILVDNSLYFRANMQKSIYFARKLTIFFVTMDKQVKILLAKKFQHWKLATKQKKKLGIRKKIKRSLSKMKDEVKILINNVPQLPLLSSNSLLNLPFSYSNPFPFAKNDSQILSSKKNYESLSNYLISFLDENLNKNCRFAFDCLRNYYDFLREKSFSIENFRLSLSEVFARMVPRGSSKINESEYIGKLKGLELYYLLEKISKKLISSRFSLIFKTQIPKKFQIITNLLTKILFRTKQETLENILKDFKHYSKGQELLNRILRKKLKIYFIAMSNKKLKRTLSKLSSAVFSKKKFYFDALKARKHNYFILNRVMSTIKLTNILERILMSSKYNVFKALKNREKHLMLKYLYHIFFRTTITIGSSILRWRFPISKKFYLLSKFISKLSGVISKHSLRLMQFAFLELPESDNSSSSVRIFNFKDQIVSNKTSVDDQAYKGSVEYYSDNFLNISSILSPKIGAEKVSLTDNEISFVNKNGATEVLVFYLKGAIVKRLAWVWGIIEGFSSIVANCDRQKLKDAPNVNSLESYRHSLFEDNVNLRYLNEELTRNLDQMNEDFEKLSYVLINMKYIRIANIVAKRASFIKLNILNILKNLKRKPHRY